MSSAKIVYQEGRIELTADWLTIYGYGETHESCKEDLRRELRRLSMSSTPFVSEKTRALATAILGKMVSRRG